MPYASEAVFHYPSYKYFDMRHARGGPGQFEDNAFRRIV